MACSSWIGLSDFDLGAHLADIAGRLLAHAAKRLYLRCSVLALGSLGRRELSPDSDLDVLFLAESETDMAEAENQASGLLAMLDRLRRFGAPFRVDAGRPDSPKRARLVRGYDEFLRYELERMGMAERLGLGDARLILGDEEAQALARRVALAQPLTPERLRELIVAKRQIETEQVAPRHVRRDLKFGQGGLQEIVWFVHLMEMRYPTATRAGVSTDLTARIATLGRARLINAVETEELLKARTHLLDLRARLALIGQRGDLLPENPDKLDVLARAIGEGDANGLLRRHERVLSTVRAIFADGMDRLRA